MRVGVWYLLLVLVLVQCAQSRLDGPSRRRRRKRPQKAAIRRLAVMTMLSDLQNNKMVRDLFTQLRSLRLVSLGNATVQLCIPTARPGGTVIGDALSLTERFGVELVFTSLAAGSTEENKYDCWRGFDADRFGHLLWLDPGTMLFRDPVGLLPLGHDSPRNTVHCVPELYSAISARRRATLPLERQGQLSCQLAVLLLDAAAVSSFVASVPAARALEASSGSQRFAAAAALGGISLRAFDSSHRLNYRVAQEAEIMRAGLHADDLQYIINFAGLPEMVHCFPEDGQCSCIYTDVRPLPLSHMNAMLAYWLNSARGRSKQRCEVMAGMRAAPFGDWSDVAAAPPSATASQQTCHGREWSDTLVSIVPPRGASAAGPLAFQSDLLRLIAPQLQTQAQHQRRGGGTIVCCNSSQGAATALQLTQRWQRGQGVLTILLLGASYVGLAERLSASCGGVCVVLLPGSHEDPAEWAEKGPALLAASTGLQSQLLVYIDTSPGTLSNDFLNTWGSRVREGGVLAGSGWGVGWVGGDTVKRVVGAWATCAGLAVRVTFADYLGGACGEGVTSGEACLPAWYVRK